MVQLVEDVGSCPVVNGGSKDDADVAQTKDDKLALVVPQVCETLKLGMQVCE